MVLLFFWFKMTQDEDLVVTLFIRFTNETIEHWIGSLYQETVSINKKEGTSRGDFFENHVAQQLEAHEFQAIKDEKQRTQVSKVLKDLIKQGNDQKPLTDLVLQSMKLDEDQWYYIQNPFGSQSPPDFMLLVSGQRLLMVECKTSQCGTPVWNCSLPDDHTLYLYHSQKKKETFVFRNDHVLSRSLRQKLLDHHKRIQEMTKLFHDGLNEDETSFYYYPRPMYSQRCQLDSKRREEWFQDTIRRMPELI